MNGFTRTIPVCLLSTLTLLKSSNVLGQSRLDRPRYSDLVFKATGSHDLAEVDFGRGGSHLCFLFAFPFGPHKSVMCSQKFFKNINTTYTIACLRPSGQCLPLLGCYSKKTLVDNETSINRRGNH